MAGFCSWWKLKAANTHSRGALRHGPFSFVPEKCTFFSGLHFTTCAWEIHRVAVGKVDCVAVKPVVTGRIRQGILDMEIKRIGSVPSRPGPAEYFTGTVRIDSLIDAAAPARTRGASVTFEPGARTAWHTHPLGQTLIVTAGCGRAQCWGGPIEEIRPGDVVWFPPGEKHWHGATPTTAMTHIAVQEALDGKAVEWLEHVSDEQYQG
jgi:quercetin dioxygenase-like cupin family protein